jgi:colanic acid/amylovoran biosynthesis protein
MTATTVAVLGGSLSGNKGAASMLLAVTDQIRSRVQDAEVLAFSPFPSLDRLQSFQGTIVDFRPQDMLLKVLPAALLCFVSIRRWRPKRGPAGALASAHVAVDVSGIAFMDGRGVVTLGYNVLMVLLPWAFGVPIVKAAQALGPFHEPINNLAARISLPLATWIGLRGEETALNVRALNLNNAEPAADVAFLLETDAEAEAAAALDLPETRQSIVLSPSSVVDEQCQSIGIDYVQCMSRLADGLRNAGHDVLIIAHSAQPEAPQSRTNDLPVCRRIAASSSARIIDRELDARHLRALIGRSRALVTSRFHAMISGLATLTPTFVIGWSHKYEEVLAEFEMQQWAVDFQSIERDFTGSVLDLCASSDEVQSTIAAHLPRVRADAERNMTGILGALSEAR